MCGRFALGLQHAQIRELHGYPNLGIAEWVGENAFVPRYNIAPNTNAPVIRQCRANGDDRTMSQDRPPASLVMQTMHWGVLYRKEPIGKSSYATNARSENIVEGVGMWNKFRGRNRCIVVCQGYYEWQTKGKHKLPHFIKHPDGKVMLMAGLYDEAIDKSEAKPSCAFAIVTTDASKSLSWLHDRQPVIFSTVNEVNQWLDTSSGVWTADLARLLHPWEDSMAPLLCYQVPMEVGRVGTESAKLIEPIANRKDGIMAMFAKQKSRQSPTKRKRSSTPTPLLHPSAEEACKIEVHEEKKLKL